MRKIEKKDLLNHQVYEIFKEMIMNGDFIPGERIVETKAAEKLGVSRGTIREAIQMLLKDELLYRTGNFINVFNPSVQDIIDIYECRKSLETLAVRLAVINISHEHLESLTKINKDSRMALQQNDIKTHTRLNQEFHDIIQVASKNKQLIQFCDLIKTKLLYIRNRFLKNNLNNLDEYMGDHEDILVAIKDRDSKKAEYLMLNHIDKSLNDIKPFLVKVIELK